MKPYLKRAWAEVSLSQLRKNVEIIKGLNSLDEAIAVRNYAPNAEILILGYTPPEYAHEISMHNIIQGVVSTEYAEALAANSPASIRCHIKIDTGMGRIGLKHDTPAECADEIAAMMKINKLSVEGIYTL